MRKYLPYTPPLLSSFPSFLFFSFFFFHFVQTLLSHQLLSLPHLLTFLPSSWFHHHPSLFHLSSYFPRRADYVCLSISPFNTCSGLGEAHNNTSWSLNWISLKILEEASSFAFSLYHFFLSFFPSLFFPPSSSSTSFFFFFGGPVMSNKRSLEHCSCSSTRTVIHGTHAWLPLQWSKGRGGSKNNGCKAWGFSKKYGPGVLFWMAPVREK